MDSSSTPLSPDNPTDVHGFLWEALQDNQATVRSIDGKLTAMLLAQIAPIPLAAGMYKFSSIWIGKVGTWGYLALCLVFAVFWIVALYHLFSGILARFDASKLIVIAERQPGGVMFPGKSYLGSKRLDLTKYLKDLPRTDERIKEELAFEVLKVAHIRMAKVHHQRTALVFMAIWIGLAVAALWVYGQFLFGANH